MDRITQIVDDLSSHRKEAHLCDSNDEFLWLTVECRARRLDFSWRPAVQVNNETIWDLRVHAGPHPTIARAREAYMGVME